MPEAHLSLKLDIGAFKKNVQTKLISKKDIAFSLKQIYELINAGTNLYTAIDIVIDLQDKPILKELYQNIKKDIEMGKPLHIAFAKKPLPSILSNMLYAAETSENLENVFKTVGDFLENMDSYKSKVISKAVYPSIVSLFSILAVFISVNYVIPRIEDVLKSFNAKLPLITIFLMYFAKVVVFFIYVSPLLFLMFIFKEKLFSKEKIDSFYLKIPILGSLITYLELSKFLYAMSLMLGSNSSIGISIRVSVQTVENNFIKQKLSLIEQDIGSGVSFHQALLKTGLFKKSVLSVIKNGEYTGDLKQALKTSYKIYEQLLDKTINFFVSSLEPMATLIVGILVSLVVLSIMLPIVDIASSVH